MDNINWFLWKCSIWHLSLTIIAEQRVTQLKGKKTRGTRVWHVERERERIFFRYWSESCCLFVECCNENWPRAMFRFSGYLTRFWQQLRYCHASGPYFRFVLATVRHLAKQTRNVSNVVAKAFSRLPFSLWIIRFRRGLHSFSIATITVTDMWPRHTQTHAHH